MSEVDASEVHPYDRHVGRYGAALAAGLIEVAAVRPGDRVLDVGCGTGQLAMAVAAIVGDDNVAAIDPTEGVVEVCRRRVPGGDVRAGAAEALPFADASFDAVLAQLVVNLVDDPPAAVREMARVARPGGVVAACFWDDDEMPLLRSFWDAAREVAPDVYSRVSAQAQVGVRDLELLREWWEGVGLGDVELGACHAAADYEGFDDLWFAFDAGIGHSGGLYTSLDAERRAEIRASAYRRLGSPQGPFTLMAKVRTVRGTR